MIISIGRLGRDPEMRYTDKGTPVTSFSMAEDIGYGEYKKTAWLRVSTFGKLAENVNAYAVKGMQVQVVGELNPDKETGGPRLWNKQDGTPTASYEIIASAVKFLSGKQEQPKSEQQESELPF